MAEFADSTGDRFESDRLVSELHADLDDFSPTITLVGFIGPSKNPDAFRLYRDLDFGSYYEIPKVALKSRSRLRIGDDNSPSVIRVLASASLRSVSHVETSVDAEAIKGGIASSFFGAAVEKNQHARGLTNDPNICTTLVCQITANVCGQGGRAAPPQAITYNNLCTTDVCVTITALVCGKGGQGPASQRITDDPNICTGLACATVSALLCANEGRGPAARGLTNDPNICTTLVCQITANVCAQGGRGPAPETITIGGICTPTAPWICNITTNYCGQGARKPAPETITGGDICMPTAPWICNVPTNFCAQGQRGAAPEGFTNDPNICTTVVCTLTICAQGGRGPVAQGLTDDPNVCTGLACVTISALLCGKPKQGPEADWAVGAPPHPTFVPACWSRKG